MNKVRIGNNNYYRLDISSFRLIDCGMGNLFYVNEFGFSPNTPKELRQDLELYFRVLGTFVLRVDNTWGYDLWVVSDNISKYYKDVDEDPPAEVVNWFGVWTGDRWVLVEIANPNRPSSCTNPRVQHRYDLPAPAFVRKDRFPTALFEEQDGELVLISSRIAVAS